MSKSTKSKLVDKNLEDFTKITGASTKDAKRYLDKYKRADHAINAYFDNPNEFSQPSTKRGNDADRTSKLNALFDKYKDTDGESITIDGTIKLCEDLEVNPEDVVLLAVAFELKSPRVGEWNKKEWVDGWKALGCDSIKSMKTALDQLSNKLENDAAYFRQVYSYTFDFARSEGQRSIACETAQAFWALLIPKGLNGRALSHVKSLENNEEDEDMGQSPEEDGWADEYTQWWFEFLNEKGTKGVSKDTWAMFLEFVRTIDSQFQHYDETAAWPSTIDDFVEWARSRLAAGAP